MPNFTIFQNFADSCLQNDPFFLISRTRASHWKNTPFFRENGYGRGIGFGRECVCVWGGGGHHVTPLWPQTNGEVERQNDSIEKRSQLEKEKADTKSLSHTLMPQGLVKPNYSAARYLTNYSAERYLTIFYKFSHLEKVTLDLEGQGCDAEVKGRDKLYADKRHLTVQSSIKPGAEVWENEPNQ